MRTGDFQELLTDPYVLDFFDGPVQIFDPSQDPGQRTAIPGNRLDQYLGGARISAIGRNFVNLFPLPNRPVQRLFSLPKLPDKHTGHVED